MCGHGKLTAKDSTEGRPTPLVSALKLGPPVPYAGPPHLWPTCPPMVMVRPQSVDLRGRILVMFYQCRHRIRAKNALIERIETELVIQLLDTSMQRPIVSSAMKTILDIWKILRSVLWTVTIPSTGEQFLSQGLTSHKSRATRYPKH